MTTNKGVIPNTKRHGGRITLFQPFVGHVIAVRTVILAGPAGPRSVTGVAPPALVICGAALNGSDSHRTSAHERRIESS